MFNFQMNQIKIVFKVGQRIDIQTNLIQKLFNKSIGNVYFMKQVSHTLGLFNKMHQKQNRLCF